MSHKMINSYRGIIWPAANLLRNVYKQSESEYGRIILR